jgi:hypothetical protein
MHNLDHPILAGEENNDSWHAKKEDLQRAFPLNVPMVPSTVITIAADGECLTCGGFSLGETVCLENFKFIADYFSGLSLSPGRGDSGVPFVTSTHSETPSLRWAMIEDSAEEFLMVSSGEGGFRLPSPRRFGTGAPLSPVATTPWLKDILNITATQQVVSSLQHWAKASVSSPWDFSSN